MEHLIERKVFKVDYEENELYILKYFLNNIMINLRLFKKIEDDYEEIFTEDVSKDEAENLMLLVNRNMNLAPLNENELSHLDNKLNNYLNTAKELITSQIEVADINKKVLSVGEVAGSIYLATKNKGDFFIELFSIHLKDRGETPEIYLINLNFAEMALLDYKSKVILGQDYVYAKANDIFYIGLIRSQYKHSSYFTVGVIEFLVDSLSCNKAYMVEVKNGKYSPLNIDKFTTGIEKALKTDVKKMCNTFIKKISK